MKIPGRSVFSYVYRLLQNSILRCVFTGTNLGEFVGEAELNILADENLKYQMLQQFGFSSKPPVGSEGVVVCISGNKEHGYVIATHHRGSYLGSKLADGESIMNSADGVTYMHFMSNGNIEINAVGQTGTITLNGNLQVNGTIDAVGDINGANFP